MKVQKEDSRTGNKSKLREEIPSQGRQQTRSKEQELNMFSEASKMTINDSFQSYQYSLLSSQKQLQNGPNFVTLSKISEQEKIEIIQIGFRLNQEGKISLKNYYESTDPCSLFQFKGYSIKYESIRRTKLYQQLKP